jgi:hypothetical protein
MSALPWSKGEEITPHVKFGGYENKGLAIVLETDRWRDFFRILLNDFIGKYVFHTKGSDIQIIVRKVSIDD